MNNDNIKFSDHPNSDTTYADPYAANKEQYGQWIRAHRYNKRHEPRLEDYPPNDTLRQFKFHFFTIIYFLSSFFITLFRLRTLVCLCLAVAATLACYFLNWTFDLPTTFLSAGIVFPISFGIQFLFDRRERVLLDIASLKASAYGLYMLAKEWPQENKGNRRQNKNQLDVDTDSEVENTYHLRKNEGEFCEKMKQKLTELLEEMSLYFAHTDFDNSRIYNIYIKFDELNHLVEEIRVSDEWLKSVVSRAYQYIRYMINDFERIRTVCEYRTPSSFRGFTFMMLTAFPMLFAPSFAKIGLDRGNLMASVYTAIVITLILVLLSNIMDDLEDPFDSDGVDDFNIAMIAEPVLLMYKPQIPGNIRRHQSSNIFGLVSKAARQQINREYNRQIPTQTPAIGSDDSLVDLK